MSKRKYWHNGKIPAELFFEILESEKLKKLVVKGKYSNRELRQGWKNIFDEYYTLLEDTKLKLIIRTKEGILKLDAKIKAAENTLKVLTILQGVIIDERTEETLKALYKSLGMLGIHIDINKPINEEILQALQITLAGFKTKLQLEQDQLKEFAKGERSTFEGNLVAMENTLGRSIGENISLRKYISYVKSAREESKRIRKSRDKKSAI